MSRRGNKSDDGNSNSNSPVRGLEDLSITTESSGRPQRSNVTEKVLKKLVSKEDLSSNFMLDFDPMKPRREKNREKRNAAAKQSKDNKKNLKIFNEKGIHLQSGLDSCDCLIQECPGCHFPCIKCKSTKCGHECRNNRKWQYESIEFENDPSKKRTNSYALTAA